MCFSLAYLGQILIYAIILGAIVAVVRLLLPMALGWMGAPATVLIQVLNIILWAAIAIFVVWICIELLSCLGGFSMPFRHSSLWEGVDHAHGVRIATAAFLVGAKQPQSRRQARNQEIRREGLYFRGYRG